jgi:galactokinase
VRIIILANLQARLLAAFQTHIGGKPDLLARAPGRVNLIGEHTDYNDGFVLPAAIGCETMVAARKRSDQTIRVIAADLENAETFFSLESLIAPSSEAPWSNYVRGVAQALSDGGVALCGADMVISGTVPQGAGLSSSASLEMAAGLALAALADDPTIDRTRLALAGQRAEHDYAGCKCGIMDQLVSARATAGHALLIDCRTLETRAVPMPDAIAVMIIHSGVSRGLVDGAYNERRAQCEEAARHYGVNALRDLDWAALEAGKSGLDDTAYRRARHVVSENARTEAAAQALARQDLRALGVLMAESHASMRNDFEITVQAIDALVDVTAKAIGPSGGARMTGGGFGGAVVALLPTNRVEVVSAAIAKGYRAPDGKPPLIMVETASNGASLIPIE